MDTLQQAICQEIPISVLECSEAFQLLSKEEKLYAHYLSKASWAGGPIATIQTSPEAPKILELILALFADIKLSDLK